MKKGYQQLVEEALAEIQTLSVEQALTLLEDSSTQFIDVREVQELEREGIIPGAFHAPRGMIEFWVDPASPYFKPVFGESKKLLLFCNKGWRSALTVKTMQDMGFSNVTHIAGGFTAWKEAGGAVGVKQVKIK